MEIDWADREHEDQPCGVWGMKDTIQDALYLDPPCLAPCWPICCDDCPFGDLGTTLDEVQEMKTK